MTEEKSTPNRSARPGPFYGYIIVIVSFCIMIAYMAARSAYGVFFDPVSSEFGWSSTLMSGPSSLSIIMDGFLGIVMGRLADRLGPRRVVTIGAALVGLGYILMSRISNVWQIYLVYGLVLGTGMGATFVPTITNLSRWFVAKRNIMNGLVLAGMGVGTMLVSPIAHWLIATHGWRTSFLILGGAFLVIIGVSAQFMRPGPAETEAYRRFEPAKPDSAPHAGGFTLGEALHTRQLWLVFCMFFCYGFYVMGVVIHIVPDIIHQGIAASAAANVLAAAGGISIIGRLAFGVIGDRLGSGRAYGLAFVIIIPALFWLAFITDTRMFYLFAIVFGLAWGGTNAVQTPLVAELFGLKAHGVIFGVCGLGATAGAAVGPTLAGYLYDTSGGYGAAFITCAVLAVAGLALNLTLARSTSRLRP